MVDKIIYDKEIKHHIIRFYPNEDLLESLNNYLIKNNIKAATVISCVGSLCNLKIRLPDLSILEEKESFEIVSLVGNIGINRTHLHISVGNSKGVCIGGHMLNNNIIYTTAEIVIIEYKGLEFIGIEDEETKFKELKIKQTE